MITEASRSTVVAPGTIAAETDARLGAGGIFAALAATLFIWFFGLAALALVVEPPVVAAFGPAAPLYADASLKIVGVRPGVTLVAGQGRGWVWRVYADGAWFVWPLTQGGCVGLRRWLTK